MNTIRKMSKSILLIAAAFVSIPAFAEGVYIESLIFNGSGCTPADTSGQLVDVDNDGFPDQLELFFSNYIVEQGPGIALSDRRKNCNIIIGMHLPMGFQFTIKDSSYIGYADIPLGVTGQQRSEYQFPFVSDTVTRGTRLEGPFVGDYNRQDNLASSIWSPCGVSAPLNIRTQVYLQGDSALPGLMTLDAPLIYNLQWRECS